MNDRRPIDAKAASWMVGLCFIWAVQQVLMKATATDVSPLLQIAIRSAVAAALVALLMTWRAEWPWSRPAQARVAWCVLPGLVVGVLFAAEFLALGLAIERTTASRAIVMLYTSPIFAALGLAWRLPSERLQVLQWGGISLAFVGVAVTLWARGSQEGDPALHAPTWVGDAWALAAGALWGATTVVVRSTRLGQAPASLTLLYQLVAAAVLLGLLAPWLGHTRLHMTTLAWVSLLFQSVVGAFASFLAWFWLLRRYQAAKLGVFVFFTPLFGLALGAWWLREPIEPRLIMGTALVVAGIVLVTGTAWLSKPSKPSKA
jgi:drug/metabolite transporter (DMT)-like permease